MDFGICDCGSDFLCSRYPISHGLATGFKHTPLYYCQVDCLLPIITILYLQMNFSSSACVIFSGD